MTAYAVGFIEIAAAIVVMVRVICLSANSSIATNRHRQARYFFYTAGMALIAGGAVGTVIGYADGPAMLLVGVAARMIFDRRA